jgi:hypothetical protein
MKVPMKYLLSLVSCLVIGCAGQSAPLVVKMQTLRDQNVNEADDPMVRHEKTRRLYGAISMEERRQRLGQYYTMFWKADSSTEKEILFQFLQGKSGSHVKSMRRQIASGSPSGKEEFAVIGDDYFDNGRVLAWKCSLISNGEVIATEQSYLWE